jgi:hypothetical protein
MKNRLLMVYIGLLFLFWIIFPGCASNYYVYDKTIPEEQLCTLKITKDYNVVKFNESKVRWMTIRSDEATVKIPAGEHKLIVDYFHYDYIGGGTYSYRRADNIEITFEFKPGKTYEFIFIIRDGKFFLTIMLEDDISPLLRLLQ